MSPLPYWAWRDAKTGTYDYVFPTRQQVEICSEDFFQTAIADGEGRIVRVWVNEIEATDVALALWVWRGGNDATYDLGST